MPLEPVHVMEMDLSTSRLELTKINPTRQWFVERALYQWQNGHYYDGAGNPLSADEVPAHIREDVRVNPVRVTITGAPEVTKNCTICGESMNSGAWDEHMVKHVHDAMQTIGQSTLPPTAPVEKRDANTHKPRP